MDQTNRAIIVSAALLLIFFALVIVMLAWGAADNSIDRLYRLSDYMANHNTEQTKLIITFGGFILALGALIVIIYELTPPKSGSLKVEVGSGDVRISTEEVAIRVEDEVRAMPQVQDVQATVTGRGTKAEVSLALHVQPDADLAAIADGACALSREMIEGRIGVRLASQPRAELHYRELQVARPEGGQVVPAAAVAGQPASIPANQSASWRPPDATDGIESPQTAHEAETASESPSTGP